MRGVNSFRPAPAPAAPLRVGEVEASLAPAGERSLAEANEEDVVAPPMRPGGSLLASFSSASARRWLNGPRESAGRGGEAEEEEGEKEASPSPPLPPLRSGGEPPLLEVGGVPTEKVVLESGETARASPRPPPPPPPLVTESGEKDLDPRTGEREALAW